MFVLDTDVVSELRKAKSGRANPGLASWASSVSSSQMFLSSITIHELEYGVLLAERSNPEQGALLRRWIDESVSAVFAGRVLPVDAAVARSAAALHIPDPAPFRDALIGATALVNGMTMVTHNVRHFRRFEGLDVLDPWD